MNSDILPGSITFWMDKLDGLIIRLSTDSLVGMVNAF